MRCQMRHRFVTLTGVLAVVTTVIVLLAPVPLASQAPTGTPAAARTWTAPRTAWGDPDLQGVWNNATSTPLERPDEFAGKAVLDEEEWEAWQKRLRETIDTDNTPRDRVGNYNDHWFDAKRKELADRRTSLI